MADTYEQLALALAALSQPWSTQFPNSGEARAADKAVDIAQTAVANKAIEKQQKEAEKKSKGGIGGLLGAGLGAALAAPTGGMSLAAGAALGGSLGGAAEGALKGQLSPQDIARLSGTMYDAYKSGPAAPLTTPPPPVHNPQDTLPSYYYGR